MISIISATAMGLSLKLLPPNNSYHSREMIFLRIAHIEWIVLNRELRKNYTVIAQENGVW